MKKILILLMLTCTSFIFAQGRQNILTDYNQAFELSKSQDKPVLVMVTDAEDNSSYKRIKETLLSNEAFQSIASEVLILKLNTSNKQSTDFRYGSHIIKQKSGFGLALVDKNRNTIGKPLIDAKADNIQNFITFIKSNL